jgi:hypothetical protein
MLEILSCSYEVNILIELCYFHETSQTFEVCLKENCAQIHTIEPLSYESKVCFIASAVELYLCVCVTNVCVKYDMLKVIGTERFLACTDHADSVET